MALKASIFPPKFLPKPIKLHTRTNTKIFCTKRISDAALVAEFAAEKLKIKTQLLQREEAMKKSKELLFHELCQYLGLGAEEMKQKWRKMDEEEKLGWAKGFVSEWGESFHPLSSKSVKELVDEKLGEEKKPLSNSSSSPSFTMFPSLKNIIGFSQKQK